MNFLKDLSIRKKLLLITIFTCSIALVLAFLALFAQELRSYKAEMIKDLSIKAQVLAGLSTGAMTFDDEDTATEILSQLHLEPHITMAVIYREGRPFAAYRRLDNIQAYPSSSAQLQGTILEEKHLSVLQPIKFKGTRLGEIYLKANTTKLQERLWEYLSILSGVFLACLLIVYLVAARLRNVITEPIFRLTDAANVIAEKKDFSIRVTKIGQDELGQLTDTFNQMLARIEDQNTALKDSRERYEVAVLGSSDGLWDWDLLTNEIYFSPRWKEMIGYQEDELENNYQTWKNLIHPDDVELTRKNLEDYLNGKKDYYEVEFRMRHKNGDYIWILSRGAALRDADRKPHRLAGSHTDITQRKLGEEKLKQMHDELLEASRQAGMAEVATGVLHNVGNVLNSVNVSATLVAQRTRQSKTASLTKVAALFQQHKPDLTQFLTRDDKGKLLPDYLDKLAEHLASEQKSTLKELDGLTRNIEHIKQIVSMQQNYAKVSGLLESIQVKDLVEDAIQINSLAFNRHGIELVRNFKTVPNALVDRHNILQILVNLLSNAKHALKSVQRKKKQVILGIAPDPDHKRIHVTIQDNGCGIAPDNLNRIFTHGFTTKKGGHGFGLHSGALAAKQMGGSLNVQSKGLDQGSTFILDLPLAEVKNLTQAA